jgi:hypothetical protein
LEGRWAGDKTTTLEKRMKNQECACRKARHNTPLIKEGDWCAPQTLSCGLVTCRVACSHQIRSEVPIFIDDEVSRICPAPFVTNDQSCAARPRNMTRWPRCISDAWAPSSTHDDANVRTVKLGRRGVGDVRRKNVKCPFVIIAKRHLHACTGFHSADNFFFRFSPGAGVAETFRSWIAETDEPQQLLLLRRQPDVAQRCRASTPR